MEKTIELIEGIISHELKYKDGDVKLNDVVEAIEGEVEKGAIRGNFRHGDPRTSQGRMKDGETGSSITFVVQPGKEIEISHDEHDNFVLRAGDQERTITVGGQREFNALEWASERVRD